jgi:hypothetical protein
VMIGQLVDGPFKSQVKIRIVSSFNKI